MLALSRVIYAVSYLEWAVLGDLPSIPGLPEELSLVKLAGQTTGEIGRTLTDQGTLAKVHDASVREWVETAGKHLSAVAVRRNSILHARPATIQNRQRLHRWEPGRGEVFTITEEFLAEALSDVSRRVRDLSSKRIAINR
jgi:hypothetical protein